MERERLVASHWETSRAGPARRVYRLTPGGRQSLHEAAAGLSETRNVVSAYLERYEVLQEGSAIDATASAGRPSEPRRRPARDVLLPEDGFPSEANPLDA